MNLNLTDEVAVVIGGGQGIGLAIAKAFAQEQAKVVLIDRNTTVLQTAEQLREEFGADIDPLVADVTDYGSMQSCANRAVETFGRCDHVINAAGAGSGKYGFPFWNLQPQDWQRVVDVNLHGTVHIAHAFAPMLVEARRGTMLFLSSVAGQIGSQSDPPYSAAKAAVINFAQCAAKDLAPYNVRVNVICPGMVKTALNRSVWQAWRDQQPEDQSLTYEAWADDKIRHVAALGRWQTAEDIAAMAVFLASTRADNITGQTINVDGGQVMHS